VLGLFLGLGVISAFTVSWYGYRALGRIQKWGEKMNEVDAIFQSAATPEEMTRQAGSGPGRGEGKPVGATAQPIALGVPR